jgi:hypothetical protein
MKETLAQIEAPLFNPLGGFCAGIVLWDDRVIEAAPIVKYMAKQRWTRDRVRDYCRQRGWRVIVVHQLTR